MDKPQDITDWVQDALGKNSVRAMRQRIKELEGAIREHQHGYTGDYEQLSNRECESTSCNNPVPIPILQWLDFDGHFHCPEHHSHTQKDYALWSHIENNNKNC